MAIKDRARERVETEGLRIKSTGGKMDQYGSRTKQIMKEGVQKAKADSRVLVEETGQSRNTRYIKKY